MTAAEALITGTLVAAEVLGLAAESGSIEVGKRADIIACAGDPTEDITSVRRPVFVMKQGRPVDLAAG